jgi:hypothetical protein
MEFVNRSEIVGCDCPLAPAYFGKAGADRLNEPDARIMIGNCRMQFMHH